MLLNNFSMEFFPPKTINGIKKLKLIINKTFKFNPSFLSVTCSTNNNIQINTFNTILDIFKNGCKVAPHITCIGNTKSSLYSLISQYKTMGIKKIIVLRGDLKNKKNFFLDEFKYAYELVNFIRIKTGNWFDIKVAAYPEKHFESDIFEEDINFFIKKVRAGVNSAITQYFYNLDAYFNFVNDIQKLGIYIPIIPGIMPIMNYYQLIKFSKVCGSEIPKWIYLKFSKYVNDIKSFQSLGIDIITEMCQKLLDNGVPSLHFYTLNNFDVIIKIFKNLNFF